MIRHEFKAARGRRVTVSLADGAVTIEIVLDVPDALRLMDAIAVCVADSQAEVRS